MFAVKLGRRVAVAVLLIAAVAYGAMLFRHLSFAAGGSDSSGYLNEARIMASRATTRPVVLLRTLHLPSQYGFVAVPLGFLQSQRDPHVMVPRYPPGLPTHFAIVGSIAGWTRAPFLLPPIAAFACLGLMFVLGRQFGLSEWQSVAASVILAACPVFIFMSAQPMSDVFATMWTLVAIVLVIPSGSEGSVWEGGTEPHLATARPHRFLGMTRHALAGAAFAISVCIRPSNLLLAIPLAFAMRWRPSRLALAIAGAMPFAIGLLAWNYALFGNPIRTGYGDMTYMVSWAFPRERLPHYAYWLAAQLTPLIFPGGLLVAFDRRVDRWHRAVLISWFVPFFTFYCFYGAYETWWYTRFLLPAIPPLIIGFLLLIRKPRVLIILVAAILALAIWQDRRLEPLAVGEDESIYPEIVHRFNFPKDAIVMSGQFTGAYLYYTGRDCIRWDQLDNDRFQLLRAYVTNANLRWYAVLTPYEWEQVQKFNASWTKLDEHRGVLFLRLTGD